MRITQSISTQTSSSLTSTPRSLYFSQLSETCGSLPYSTFFHAPSRESISFRKFVLEMFAGTLYRAPLRICSDIVENRRLVGGLIAGVLNTVGYTPEKFSKIILGTMVGIGICVSIGFGAKGLYEGWNAYQNGNYTLLVEASTEFGIGIWGLAFTHLGMKLGKKYENYKNLGGAIGFILHSPDEIVASLAIGNNYNKITGSLASLQSS